MEITHRTRGSTTIIRLCGRWVCGYDLRTDLRAHIQRLIEAGRFDVMLDLGDVTFIDSTVVGEIAWAHVTLHRHGGRLTLLNPTERMSRLLSISRLASVVDIRRSPGSPAEPSAGSPCAITRSVDAASHVPFGARRSSSTRRLCRCSVMCSGAGAPVLADRAVRSAIIIRQSMCGGRVVPLVMLASHQGLAGWSRAQGDDMRTKIGLIVAAASLLASCGAEAPTGPPFRTDATVRMLMANLVDPAADLVWDAVGTIIDANGENHWEPETEEDWISVRYGAMSMIEAGNLLMMETRARDQDQWIRFSEAMMDAGLLMFQAAEDEDADRVFALGEEVYTSCNNCHQLYWVDDADRGRAIESSSGGAAP